jgi:PAS domain S-box-containing protein
MKPGHGATREGGSPSDAFQSMLPRIIEAMSDAVVVLDRKGHVVASNQRFAEVFPEDTSMPGRPCPHMGDCLPGEDLSKAVCIACQVASDRRPQRRIHVIADATGRQRRWEATLSPVFDEAGEVQYVVESWRDISERTMLEAQLSHSEHLAKLGLLAAGVAHELNNPLGALRIGVDALQRLAGRVELPPAEAEYLTETLGDMEQCTQRCIETARKLRMLGEQQTTRPDWVDLNVAASETLDLLRYAALKQGIVVNRELAEALPPIWGNGGTLRGALMHLCFNAVQAMPNGGHLTVRTRQQGEQIVIEVADDGPGIPPEHLARLWDPFFTTKPVGQGTGLGLSITRRTLMDHGGNIEVASTPGAGACFTVTLPVGGAGGDRG